MVDIACNILFYRNFAALNMQMNVVAFFFFFFFLIEMNFFFIVLSLYQLFIGLQVLGRIKVY